MPPELVTQRHSLHEGAWDPRAAPPQTGGQPPSPECSASRNRTQPNPQAAQKSMSHSPLPLMFSGCGTVSGCLSLSPISSNIPLPPS